MRRGPAGTNVLNPLLQAVLNPPAAHKAELQRHGGHSAAALGDGLSGSSGLAHPAKPVFRIGDRVIQLVRGTTRLGWVGDPGDPAQLVRGTTQI